MSYGAVGDGSLTLRFDNKSKENLRAGLALRCDSQCQAELKQSEPFRKTVRQRCRRKKQALKQAELGEWLRHEFSDIGYYDVSAEEDPAQQTLHIETSFDGKYHEEWLTELLDVLQPYTVEGQFSYCGEDGEYWRLLFTDAGWVEQHGEITYTNTSPAQVDLPYRAAHLGWDELCGQLQALVTQLLGPEYRITIGRLDYYYWEMKIGLPSGMDEALSAKLCERLELVDAKPDHFMDSNVADDNQLLHLLEKLTGHEVSSSHADDYGVWIICKGSLIPGQEHTTQS